MSTHSRIKVQFKTAVEREGGEKGGSVGWWLQRGLKTGCATAWPGASNGPRGSSPVCDGIRAALPVLVQDQIVG